MASVPPPTITFGVESGQRMPVRRRSMMRLRPRSAGSSMTGPTKMATSTSLLCRAAPPILLELSAWTTRRDAKELILARGVAERAIQQASAARNRARATVGSQVTPTSRPSSTEVELAGDERA